MDPYTTPYVSVIPRLIPSQYSSKKIPMSDEGYEYDINRPISSYTSPQNHSINSQPLNGRNAVNQQDSNPTFYQNSQENFFKGRNNKNRLHHEPLKDNSGENYSPNPYSAYTGYGYSPPADYKSYENFQKNSSEDKFSKSSKILIIIFGILIGIFALTALTISIYLLIKISSSSTTITSSSG